jgi:hypothetical protein
MDVYLPNDFYELRSDLPDWSDVAPIPAAAYPSGLREESVDPSWRAL